MQSFLIILLCLNIHWVFGKKSVDEDSSFSTHGSSHLPIQHSFGPDDKFTSRGVISFKSGAMSEGVQLTIEEIKKLKKLADTDGLYFIRTPSKIGGSFSDNDNDTDYVMSFVKACFLYGSGLEESITLAVDFAGNVIGLNIVSPRSDCSGNVQFSQDFNTTVNVNNQVAGAVPDTQTFIKKFEQEKADQAAGKGRDNRSFLAKYWMYILPVFLILMLSAQAEPSAEGGGSE